MDPARFVTARSAYAGERHCPFGDKEFAADWNREGQMLAAA